MIKKGLVSMTARMKRGYAGLPRRKVCIRAVHHIFRLKLDMTEDGEKDDDNPP